MVALTISLWSTLKTMVMIVVQVTKMCPRKLRRMLKLNLVSESNSPDKELTIHSSKILPSRTGNILKQKPSFLYFIFCSWYHTPHIGISRAEIVCWVAESIHPFKIVEDRGFKCLMKIGQPEYWIPSASTVSRDVKLVFSSTYKRIMKMLQQDTLNPTRHN